jgi:O-acetyl-ADP-ribose deacetylase (regulator of RNase III)
MTIERGTGNLLEAEVDALVNTVNTEGIMGKGIALQFKRAFPENFREYERACKAGDVVPGQMHIVPRLSSPRFIINFPTKKTWRADSKIEYIRDGLEDLVAQVDRLGISSIAIPPLGCGHGGLDWTAVKPLILKAFDARAHVRVVLFEPGETPAAERIVDHTDVPKMTPGRAAVIALMHRYDATGFEYSLSLLEVQKLAYFLQLAGEKLRLTFEQHRYGPYADGLRKVLRTMEGHYTLGVADGDNKPMTSLQLQPNANIAANEFLLAQPETHERIDKVAALIEGFETPFGMELLSTLHWVMRQAPDRENFTAIVASVRGWSDRKRDMFKDGQIKAAWLRLQAHEWVWMGA